MTSLSHAGDNTSDTSPTTDQVAPRKRMRGERIVWTPEEDEHLRRAVQIYGDKTEKWAKIAACVPGRTNKNCRKRWFHSLDPSLKKGGWTPEEDQLLRTGVQKFRGQWSKIAERIQGRTDDQCAKRWRESLDPDIDRAAWTPEDDLLLLQKFEEYGTQWQKIAAVSFPGRPGLHCRNRWRKIQRSLNQMQRANKRRRNPTKDSTSGTGQNADSQHDHDSTSGKNSSESVLRQTPSDDYNMRNGCIDGDDLTENRSDSNPDEEKPYGCAIPDCGYESSSPSLLYYHFKASHHGTTVLKPFRCTMPGCEDRKRYKNINGLQYHVNHAKNSLGHCGHGGEISEKDSQPTMPETPSASASPSFTSSVTTPTGEVLSAIPKDTFTIHPSAITGSISTSHTLLPTPVQRQSLISNPFSPPVMTHQAFNIPHTPESMEESSVSPLIPCDISISQSHSASFQCPELGCGQMLHSLPGLTSHMANNHGHQSITMESSNETLAPTLTNTFGSESIAIPESDFDDVDMNMDMDMDMDMDMAYLASTGSSPILNPSNILLMNDPQYQIKDLQDQMEKLTQDHEALDLGDDNIQLLPSMQDMDILSLNEFLFANYITNSLNALDSASISTAFSNRIHFGTHINISANDVLTLPSTPMTSANVSPRLSAAAVSIPSAAFVGASLVGKQGAASVAIAKSDANLATKKFPCLAAGCPKTYGSTSAMRAHMKNEHPDLYTKSTRAKSVNATVSTPGVASSMSPNFCAGIVIPLTNDNDIHGDNQIKQKLARKQDDSLEKLFKCLVPGCGKAYKNINGLKNHLLQAHGSTPSKKAAN
ncbi:hypothetical protein BX616_009833 [Lobosporangium transversale]|nr:hypothetical protein BX616_009833 [Lobosporangium transversale]